MLQLAKRSSGDISRFHAAAIPPDGTRADESPSPCLKPWASDERKEMPLQRKRPWRA